MYLQVRCQILITNKEGMMREGKMIILAITSYAGLLLYNQKMLEGCREDEALVTFMAWVWISSFVILLGGAHKLKFCSIGTIILFSNMPMLSIIGLGWIGAFEAMIFQARKGPQLPHKKELSVPEAKKQKRLDYIRKTVIAKRINHDSPLCGESCAICLYGFQKSDSVCFSPNSKCTHGFHLSCAEDWLSHHVRCPCCREHYLLKAGKKHVEPEADPASPSLKHG